jgi:hypothetical protein
MNTMTLDGKSISGNATLTLNLADDLTDVSGFGQPITPGLAKRMTKNYYDDYDTVDKLITKIDNDTTGIYSALKTDPAYLILKKLLAPSNHIVSGVFGKEIILQILSQKNCEGIRYLIGQYQNQMTVILMGVKEIATGQSEPVPSLSFMQGIAYATPATPTDPLLGEVHKASLTVEQLRQYLSLNFLSDPNDILFGSF